MSSLAQRVDRTSAKREINLNEVMFETDEPLKFKKRISTSTDFLTDIWHTWDNDALEVNQHSRSQLHFSNKLNNRQLHYESDGFFKEEIQTDSAEQLHHNRVSRHLSIEEGTSLHRQNGWNGTCQHAETGSLKMNDSNWTPESLITEEYLEKVLISKVQEEKKLSYFYMQSRVLYKYLSYHIGSETMINVRRKVMDKRFSRKHGICGMSMQITRSKGEGLAMNGSDTDIMIEIAQAYEQELSETGISYDSLNYNEQPGYVPVVAASLNDESYCLQSSDVKNHILSWFSFFDSFLSFSFHGPALSGSFFGSDIDMVSCLKSPKWPNIAEEWIWRKRVFGWPSKVMIENIVSTGCHIVPVSGKVGQHDQIDGPEWRLSFSIAEMKLVRSFCHVQILIYGMLKLLLKDIIEKDIILKDILCSYFLKTTLFWIIEENSLKIWDPKYTIVCFTLCLKRLIGYVIEENCPNYFVPVNNMFKGRFTESQKEGLLDLLFDVYDQGLKWTVHSPTLYNLTKYMKDPYTVYELDFYQKMKEKKEKVELLLSLIRMCKVMIALFPTHHRLIGSYLKSLLRIPIIKMSSIHHICHFIDTNKFEMRNKDKYVLKQKVLGLILHGSEMDRTSRVSMLASWLYENKKVTDCIKLIDEELRFLKRRVFHSGIFELNALPRLLDVKLDFYEILKFYSTMDIQLPSNSNISLCELTTIGQRLCSFPRLDKYLKHTSREWIFFPEQYLYFIKCLCYIQLGDDQRYEDSLKELTNIQFVGSDKERVLYMIYQMMLKIIIQLSIRGEKDLPSIIIEETKHFANLTTFNNMKHLVFQGFVPEVDYCLLQSFQIFRSFKETENLH